MWVKWLPVSCSPSRALTLVRWLIAGERPCMRVWRRGEVSSLVGRPCPLGAKSLPTNQPQSGPFPTAPSRESAHHSSLAWRLCSRQYCALLPCIRWVGVCRTTPCINDPVANLKYTWCLHLTPRHSLFSMSVSRSDVTTVLGPRCLMLPWQCVQCVG